ncbi:hypothetical protein ALC57_08631 [Trachymyrmex cornetzi]|uniref:Uncharacterized protein n=1 Tax=Trachymyrmex cornetzi TaxID=471704 RepID=A0A195E1E8_9HYME|nr:hypothetical protein ALC57_08631 [Trachymyrmex cornetzi]
MLFFSAEAIASVSTGFSLAFSPESRSFAVTRTTDVPAGSFSAGKSAEMAAIAGRSWKRREKYEPRIELPRDSREIHRKFYYLIRAYVNVNLLFMLKLTTEMN